MLTNEIIRGLGASDRIVKKSDGGGLYISVTPGGAARWYLTYRYLGKQKALAGGKYPDVSIDRARVWREEIKKSLKNGTDPATVVRTKEQHCEKETIFRNLADEWMEKKRCDWGKQNFKQIESYLIRDVFPYIGSLPVRSITSGMMLEVLHRIEQRGVTVVPHIVRGYCSEIFRSGIPDGRVTTNPCRDLDVAMRRRPPVRHYAKLPAEDFPRFFAALNADPGARITHIALRWTIMTMVRTRETRLAQWCEFEGLNGPEPIWRIPAARMKKRKEHIIPLPPHAIKLLREIKTLNVAGQLGNENCKKYLFPGPNNDGVIAHGTMSELLNRLDIGHVTVHGFRASASSILNESGLFSGDWIELQLAHMPIGVRGVYNKALYLEHRRKMLCWWADYLDRAEVASRDLRSTRLPIAQNASHLDWLQSEW